jgi:hypothetical protein
MSQNSFQHPDMEQNCERVQVPPFQAMGLNDNLDFLGTQLHIQTENAQYPTPRIITHVFSKGRIMLSKKSEYPADFHNSGNPDRIHELMRVQHSQVIQDISDKQKHIQSNLNIPICS